LKRTRKPRDAQERLFTFSRRKSTLAGTSTGKRVFMDRKFVQERFPRISNVVETNVI
jgi:hypothetical protein